MRLNKQIYRNSFLLLLLTTLFSTAVFSQERLVPLQNNPAYLKVQKPNYVAAKKALSLPFIDDFSTTDVYPAETLWEDHDVYINVTLGKNPPTIGVASFDGLNGEGKPWNPANLGEEDTKASQLCDALTSQPIDLSKDLINEENLYLSFFYQPEGFASKPEINDSLLVEVKTDTDEWETVWRMPGSKFHEFKTVLIHLGDSTEYLHDDFQFRFVNYATPTGYNDFWHIDYVELNDRVRNPKTEPVDSNGISYYADEILNYRDFAFVYEPTSIFKDYSEMTLGQFFGYQDAVTNENHSITIGNLDFQATNNFKAFYQINSLSADTIIYDKDLGQLASIESYNTINESINTPKFTNNPNETDLILLPNFLDDIVEIEMKYFFESSDGILDQIPQNDTISRIYTFNNQLAYDDGIVDIGYGVPDEAAQIAQKYEIYERDFVYGVLIHFAQINLVQTDREFTLKVWESLEGIDGADETVVLASKPNLRVVYPEGDNHTGYVLYCFDDGIPVINKFYIGIQQAGSVEIHLGYDRNNDSKENLFFTRYDEWTPSAEVGSVMMRPIIGRALDLEVDCNIETVCPVLGQTCIDSNGNESMYGEDCTCALVGIFDHPITNLDFTIYPNPANELIALQNVHQSLLRNSSVEMMDATGKVIKSFEGLEASYYIGDMPVGIYFIRVMNERQQSGIKKFIKTK